MYIWKYSKTYLKPFLRSPKYTYAYICVYSRARVRLSLDARHFTYIYVPIRTEPATFSSATSVHSTESHFRCSSFVLMQLAYVRRSRFSRNFLPKTKIALPFTTSYFFVFLCFTPLHPSPPLTSRISQSKPPTSVCIVDYRSSSSRPTRVRVASSPLYLSSRLSRSV